MLKRFLLSSFLLSFINLLTYSPHYYCTSADSRFYQPLLRLISSIAKSDKKNFKEISVFDLGFTKKQRSYLEKLDKVRVCDIKTNNPDVLKPFRTSSGGRKVRGWFAWKPIAMKQALERYPYFLYLDSAMEILKPLDALFEYIRQKGYFLITAGKHNISNRITKKVLHEIVEKLSHEAQTKLMRNDTYMISAGIQGLSRKIYDEYLLPVYNTTQNLDLYADDGTAKMGFGAGRHDQTIFSIYAHLLHMKIHPIGWINLEFANKTIRYHMHWNRKMINSNSAIFY